MSQLTRDMLQITRCSNQFRNDYLAPYGLKTCPASYLTSIYRNPGISQDKLAKMIYIDKSNVARQTVILEEQGFLTRVASREDKRVMQLYLTQKGTELMPVIFEMYTKWSDLLTQDLTEAETQQLTELLAKIKIRATEWMEAR